MAYGFIVFITMPVDLWFRLLLWLGVMPIIIAGYMKFYGIRYYWECDRKGKGGGAESGRRKNPD